MFMLLLYFHRTILSALHFNYNLKRETKVHEAGNPIFRVTYSKFKDGEATVREAKVSANYGNSPERGGSRPYKHPVGQRKQRRRHIKIPDKKRENNGSLPSNLPR